MIFIIGNALCNIRILIKIYIELYCIVIYIYIYISTFYAFMIKCHRMVLSKRLLKNHLKDLKNPLYFGLFKDLLKT